MKVILNADDFGKSPGRNQAIDDCFRQGLISSAGMIVTGLYLQDAVDKMKWGGYCDRIHLHFNLSANQMHEGSEDTPLTENMQKDPFFCEDGKFKAYNGLPHNLSDIGKWRIVYDELVAQYNRFIEVTEGKADYTHVDFHLWYNLTWPAAIALNIFSWRYHIRSVRYIGLHQMRSMRYRLLRVLSQKPFVRYIPATNIDYYLSNKGSLDKNKVLELYCHPHYKDGVFLDDSPSYLKHERQLMKKHHQLLREAGCFELISWSDI